MIGPDGSLYSGSMDGHVYAFHDTKRGKPTQGPLSGTWYGSVSVGGQEQRLAMVLSQRGSQVDGVLRTQSTLAGGLRGTLQGERLSYTAWLLGDCRVEHKGDATATPQEISASFQTRDCQGRTFQGTFRVGR